MTSHKYNAFLSYSHSSDRDFATKLQSALHRFAKPWYRTRAVRIFRDSTNLSATPELWSRIELALAQSNYLLLLASESSAKSKWVRRELEYWLSNRDQRTLILLVTDGTLLWDDNTNDFDWGSTTAIPRLASAPFKEEPLYLDCRPFKQNLTSKSDVAFRDAVATIAATLHGREKDEIVGDDVRQRQRTLRTVGLACVMLMLLSCVAVVFGVQSWQRGSRIASQNNELIQRLAKFYMQVAATNSLEGKPAEALHYYHRAYSVLPLDDPQSDRLREYIGLSAKFSLPEPVLMYFTTDEQFGFPRMPSAKDWNWPGTNSKPYRPTAVKLSKEAGGKIQGIALSTDGQTAVVVHQKADSDTDAASSKSFVRVCETATGNDICKLPIESGQTLTASVSSDGRYVITGGSNGLVQLWDARQGIALASTLRHDSEVFASCISSDCKRAITVGKRLLNWSIVRMWDVEANTVIYEREFKSRVGCVAFSPHDKYAIVGVLSSGGAILLDGRTCKPINSPQETTNEFDAEQQLTRFAKAPEAKVARAFAFNADETEVVFGGAKWATLWKPFAQPQKLNELYPQTSTVEAVAFSSDANIVAIGGSDRSVRLWDSSRALPISEPFFVSDRVVGLAFSPGGSSVVVCTADGDITRWTFPAVISADKDLIRMCLEFRSGLARDEVTDGIKVLEVSERVEIYQTLRRGGHTSSVGLPNYVPFDEMPEQLEAKKKIEELSKKISGH